MTTTSAASPNPPLKMNFYHLHFWCCSQLLFDLNSVIRFVDVSAVQMGGVPFDAKNK